VSRSYYSPDTQRAPRVHELFARIARRYDLLNDIMSAGLHRRWKRRVVTLAGRPSRSLDLCCGTGDVALHLPGTVIGLDFTAEMLHIAAARNGHARWVQADALQLPFPDASFDIITVGYGLRNLADLPAGLAEIHRVLRPGGRLLALDFGKPSSPTWRAIYFAYLRTALPALGWLFYRDAHTYRYVLDSLQHYPAQRGVRALMEQAGFIGCNFEESLFGAMAINTGTRPPTA